MPTQDTAIATPSPSLTDRIVVVAKLPTDDTSWVHTDLPDWQSAIYEIDTETPHNESTLDPLTNSTLRRLRNKGREANAYLAHIIQNYNNLLSTIAFAHPHRDGYPAAWNTDNDAHSNALSPPTSSISTSPSATATPIYAASTSPAARTKWCRSETRPRNLKR